MNHCLELNVRQNIVQLRRRRMCPQQLSRDRLRDETPRLVRRMSVLLGRLIGRRTQRPRPCRFVLILRWPDLILPLMLQPDRVAVYGVGCGLTVCFASA